MIKMLIAITAGIIKGTRSVSSSVKNVLDQANTLANQTQQKATDTEFAEKNYHLSLFLKTQHLLMPKFNDKIKFNNDGQKMRYLHFIFGAIDQLSRTIKKDENRELWGETATLAQATLLYPVDEALSACKLYGQGSNSDLHAASERGFYAMETYILASVKRATKEEFSSSTSEMYDVVTQHSCDDNSVHKEIAINEMLKRDFGVNLPITGGSGNSIENAVVINYGIPNDYVSVENSYLRCLGLGRQVSWKSIKQEVLNVGNQTYDKIKIEVTQETEDETITTIENYYFNITECFGRS